MIQDHPPEHSQENREDQYQCPVPEYHRNVLFKMLIKKPVDYIFYFLEHLFIPVLYPFDYLAWAVLRFDDREIFFDLSLRFMLRISVCFVF